MKTAIFFCLALAAAGAQAAPSAIGAELGRRTLPKAARMSSSNAAFAWVAAADKACDEAWRECRTKEELVSRGKKLREDFIKALGGFPA